MPAIPVFRPGERVCWIGDSISRGGLFHALVRLFHATRYPQFDLAWHNCGISGDSAEGALRRYDWDLAARLPALAVVMFGMNDVRRDLYAPGKGGPACEQERTAAIAACATALDALVARLAAQGCRVVCATPTPYDQTGRQAETCLFGVDDALAACGVQAQRIAARHGAATVDLHGPLAALNARLQRDDPASSLVGPDRVHPGPPGHLAMAHLFLAAQGHAAIVDRVAIDAGSGQVTELENAGLAGLEAGPERVAFTLTPRALPFPVPPDSRQGLAWVPFQRELNREELVVGGLRPGRYRLSIAGEPVRACTAAELAVGIDLADEDATPQHRQAVAVAAIDRERHRLESDILRTLAAVEHFHLRPRGVDMGDRNAVDSLVRGELEKARATGFAYGAWQMETWLEWGHRTAEVRASMADQERTLRAALAPAALRYEIAPA